MPAGKLIPIPISVAPSAYPKQYGRLVQFFTLQLNTTLPQPDISFVYENEMADDDEKNDDYREGKLACVEHGPPNEQWE